MARNSIPDQPPQLNPAGADELFLWSNANTRMESVTAQNLSKALDGALIPNLPAGGASAFTDLTDVHPNYTDAPDIISENNPNPKTIAVKSDETGLELEWNISRTAGRGVGINTTTIALSTGWNVVALNKAEWGTGVLPFWSAGDPTKIIMPADGYYSFGSSVIFEKAGGIATPFGILIVENGTIPTSPGDGPAGQFMESTSFNQMVMSCAWARYNTGSSDYIELYTYCNEAGIVLREYGWGFLWMLRHAFRVNGDYTSS